MPAAPTPDWDRWLLRWDRQQVRYIPFREARFTAMFDAIEGTLPKRFRALDLGCGPGSLSLRLLRRFPSAQAVAIDHDPVLLELGRRALPSFEGRLTWVDTDLRSPNWHESLPRGRFDAALSTTALHWLTPRQLSGLYRGLHQRLRPWGVFLNGDHMNYNQPPSRLDRLADDVQQLARRRSGTAREGERWSTWWARLAREPALKPLFRERRLRYPDADHHDHPVSLEYHQAALRRAGFRESGVIWSEFGDRVLLAFA
ncbi:MAG: class I SAM-dependent methyltransferase [Thermoplasmata archaeon]